MKQIKILTLFIVLIMSFSITAKAENKEITNFITDEINFCRVVGEKQLDLVLNKDKTIMFSSEVVREKVYTTTDVYLRGFPNTESDIKTVIPKNYELIRVGRSRCGWDIILLENEKFFIWNDYITTEHPGSAIIYTSIPQEIKDKYEISQNSTRKKKIQLKYVVERPYNYSKTYSEEEAKEEIAYRESRGSYEATNGKYIGRYQLDKAYLNGDFSPENQEKTADNYVKGRYGSWQKALEFWNNNGWY